MVEVVKNRTIDTVRQTLQTREMGRAMVVEPGRLQNLKGIESLSRLPNLHRELTDFIGAQLGIKVTDILCDAEGKIAVMAANPSFIERIRNSGGNLEVLGHKVVIETTDGGSGKLYLLRNQENIRTASVARKTTVRQKSRPTRSAPKAITGAVNSSTLKHAELWAAIKGIIDYSYLPNKIFQAGPHRIKITSPGVEPTEEPQIFTFSIEGILEPKGRRDITLACAIRPSSVELEIIYPDQYGSGFTIYSVGRYRIGNTSISFKKDIEVSRGTILSFQVRNLNLQAIAQALLSVIKASEIDSIYAGITARFAEIFNVGKQGPAGRAKVLLKQMKAEISKLPDQQASAKCTAFISRIIDLLSQLKRGDPTDDFYIDNFTAQFRDLAEQIKVFK